MRRLMIALVLAGLAAAGASAQDAPKQRRMTVIPQSAGAGSETSAKTASAMGRSLAPGRLASRRPLLRLSSSAGAPQCRAQCAQSRYACAAQAGDGGGGDCDTSWGQCVVACGSDAYRYSDTSAQGYARSFGPQ